MTLPDGTKKEGFFSNNIFYGDNSPANKGFSSNETSPIES